MIPFSRKKPTIIELMKWKRNKFINPRSNRTIKEKGKIYKLFKNTYYKIFPKGFDYLDSLDNKDPVSLNKFWIIENNKKKFIYKNIDNLILYKDSNNFIKCIEKSTIEHLNHYNINYHPCSFEKFPDSILKNINKLKIKNNVSLRDKSINIFKSFENNSIFINHELFLNLDKNKLSKLNFELKEFYYENISLENRIKIDKKDGNSIFKKTSNMLNESSILEVQNYILDQIKLLLNYDDINLKFMLNYIILAGLSLVIPQIKEEYPDFLFSF